MIESEACLTLIVLLLDCESSLDCKMSRASLRKVILWQVLTGYLSAYWPVSLVISGVPTILRFLSSLNLATIEFWLAFPISHTALLEVIGRSNSSCATTSRHLSLTEDKHLKLLSNQPTYSTPAPTWKSTWLRLGYCTIPEMSEDSLQEPSVFPIASIRSGWISAGRTCCRSMSWSNCLWD